jgi:hypothetical protein
MAHSWAVPADSAELGLTHDGTLQALPRSVPAWGGDYEILASGLCGIGNCGGALGF